MIELSMIISILLIVLTYIINKRKKYNIDKLSPIECGFEPYEEEKERYYVNFYIIGILFLIFDLEVVLIYPYISIYPISTLYENNSTMLYTIFILFIYFIVIGLYYEYNKKLI